MGRKQETITTTETKTRNKILDERCSCLNGEVPLHLLEMFCRKSTRIDYVLDEKMSMMHMLWTRVEAVLAALSLAFNKERSTETLKEN